MTNVPDVVARYLQAADARDTARLVACFTPDGTAFDEGRTYTGPAEIAQWREGTISTWTYTTTVTGSERLDDGLCRVEVRVEGDFPGGVADLGFAFVLDGDLIASLTIA